MAEVPTSQLSSYGYYVGYKLANASNPAHYKTLRVGSGTLNRQETTLNGLRKFSFYAITVQAFNKAGAGPKSNQILVHTDEDGLYRLVKIVIKMRGSRRKERKDYNFGVWVGSKKGRKKIKMREKI